MFKHDSKGYSLTEVIIVLAIIGVLFSLAFASMQEYAGSIKLRTAIETIAVDIRLARITAWSSRESCYLSFYPATSSYTMNGSRYVNIPEGIRFGTDPSVKGKPTEPGEMPPADGISFESEGINNRAHFLPKGTVIPAGALYLTNGKETVEADTGLIGGTSSHEFMVLADTGEETIVYSDQGTFAANVERAEVLPPAQTEQETPKPLQSVSTPNCRSIEEVTAFLKVPANRLVKTLIYTTGKETVAVLVRGDHAVNEIKLKKVLGVTEIELAGPATVEKVTGAPVGFAGPVGLKGIPIFADHAVPALRNVVVGANQPDTHYVDANWERDFKADQVLDLRNAQAGDPSPRRDGTLKTTKGIEVGHVFMLGTKYSKAMNATFLDPQGKECLAIMGCYGIGVSRSAAASIEQNHDDRGIIWPFPIAPFHVHLSPVSQSEKTAAATAAIYADLAAGGFEVLWDDRDDRAGVKFNDADLIGAPFQVVVGDKGLAEGVVEVKVRRSGVKTRIAPTELLQHLRTTVRDTESQR